MRKKKKLKGHVWYFPGGPMVKNLPCSAGDASLIPGGEGTKIPHAGEQLSPCTEEFN